MEAPLRRLVARIQSSISSLSALFLPFSSQIEYNVSNRGTIPPVHGPSSKNRSRGANAQRGQTMASSLFFPSISSQVLQEFFVLICIFASRTWIGGPQWTRLWRVSTPSKTRQTNTLVPPRTGRSASPELGTPSGGCPYYKSRSLRPH